MQQLDTSSSSLLIGRVQLTLDEVMERDRMSTLAHDDPVELDGL